MLLNLSTLRSELANMIKNTSISTERRDRWLNLAQDDVVTEMDPEHLDTTITFSSVAAQRTYYIDTEFNQILSLTDTTNDLELVSATEGEIIEVDPDFSDSGTSYNYSITGMSWVSGQPSSASVITVVSSSASDTTQKVRINGLDGNGVEITELLSLNGTSDVVGSISFSEIRQMVKDTSTVGIMTATSNAAAVTIVRIPAHLLAKQYQPINLFPIPSGVSVYSVRGMRRPRQMFNTQDYPDLPASYHELVLIGGAIRGHIDRFRPTLARSLMAEQWKPMVKKLKGQMGNKRVKRSPIVSGGIPIFFGGRLPSDFPLVP